MESQELQELLLKAGQNKHNNLCHFLRACWIVYIQCSYRVLGLANRYCRLYYILSCRDS